MIEEADEGDVSAFTDGYSVRHPLYSKAHCILTCIPYRPSIPSELLRLRRRTVTRTSWTHLFPFIAQHLLNFPTRNHMPTSDPRPQHRASTSSLMRTPPNRRPTMANAPPPRASSTSTSTPPMTLSTLRLKPRSDGSRLSLPTCPQSTKVRARE